MKSLIAALFGRYVIASKSCFSLTVAVVVKVLEETGYDLSKQLSPDNCIEMSIKEQRISLYIVPGVPEDYPFQTRTRKEISVRLLGLSYCAVSDDV